FLLPSWPLIMLGVSAVAIFAARSGGALATLAVAWLVVALGVRGLSSERGSFRVRQDDARFVAAAQSIRSLTADDAVVFALLHGGPVRYYGGRMTIRYDQ